MFIKFSEMFFCFYCKRWIFFQFSWQLFFSCRTLSRGDSGIGEFAKNLSEWWSNFIAAAGECVVNTKVFFRFNKEENCWEFSEQTLNGKLKEFSKKELCRLSGKRMTLTWIKAVLENSLFSMNFLQRFMRIECRDESSTVLWGTEQNNNKISLFFLFLIENLLFAWL